MSKLRRLMNRLSHGALTSVAALALTVTATNMTVAAGLFSDRTSYRIMRKNLENFKVVTGYDC